MTPIRLHLMLGLRTGIRPKWSQARGQPPHLINVANDNPSGRTGTKTSRRACEALLLRLHPGFHGTVPCPFHGRSAEVDMLSEIAVIAIGSD